MGPGIADAPSGHGIGLGDAVDGDGAIEQLRLDLGDGRELQTVEGDVLVDIVGDDADAGVLQQHVGQRPQVRFLVNRAGRVVGRIQQQPAGFRRDRLRQLVRRQLEILFHAAGHDHRHAAREFDHVDIGDVIGRGQDDFVPIVRPGGEGVEDHLLGAVADDDLVAGVLQAVLALELGDDRVFQLVGSADRGIGRLAVQRGLMRGLDHVIGGREIRLPGR